MNTLETIEWTQYWAENCREDTPRLLMIGDSISVGYRHAVFERLHGRLGAVTISTSKAADNTSFLREIRFIASEEGFRYPVIHFNNGLHGGHLSTEAYAEACEKAVRFLRENFPEAKLILALSTPLTRGPENAAEAEENETVLRRNEKLRQLAEKYSLPVDDLYAAAAGHPEYKAPDGCHFNETGYAVLADAVVRSVEAALGSEN